MAARFFFVCPNQGFNQRVYLPNGAYLINVLAKSLLLSSRDRAYSFFIQFLPEAGRRNIQRFCNSICGGVCCEEIINASLVKRNVLSSSEVARG